MVSPDYPRLPPPITTCRLPPELRSNHRATEAQRRISFQFSVFRVWGSVPRCLVAFLALPWCLVAFFALPRCLVAFLALRNMMRIARDDDTCDSWSGSIPHTHTSHGQKLVWCPPIMSSLRPPGESAFPRCEANRNVARDASNTG